MHTFRLSQEQFCARIYRKKAGQQIKHPDQAPALARKNDLLFGGEKKIGFRWVLDVMHFRCPEITHE